MTEPAAGVDTDMVQALTSGNRTALARAITLVESTRPDHRARAAALLAILPAPRQNTWRVAISGTPGAGKSTLIEALGTVLTGRGHRVGVLAIDPSSVRTGGSVLGDKTRMPRLAADERAYVRPSPTAGSLGGVARATAHTIPLVEAAGYDVILVETVGVGQSEISAAAMVDTFVLLGLARSGDELQGIKRGVLEIADVVAINKADGDGAADARAAAKQLGGALRLVHAGASSWLPPVITCSGLTGDGVDELWQAVTEHRESLGADGVLAKRQRQAWDLVGMLVRDHVLHQLETSEAVRVAQAQLRPQVQSGSVSAAAAADAIIAALMRR